MHEYKQREGTVYTALLTSPTEAILTILLTDTLVLCQIQGGHITYKNMNDEVVEYLYTAFTVVGSIIYRFSAHTTVLPE